MNTSLKAEEMISDQARAVGAAGLSDAILLPGLGITIQDTADELFGRIGPTETLFNRGGAVVAIADGDHGQKLEVISSAAARSRFESYGEFYVRREKNGEIFVKPGVVAQEMAAALLESEAAHQFLPKITGLINCPIIMNGQDGDPLTIAGPGFHRSTGLFVTGGATPPHVELAEAVGALKNLIGEFDFQSSGDKSRALASFITPALKLGGHLRGNVPADVAESDKSQSGKTFRQKMVAALYNETPSLVTSRAGGVGSVDESLGQQLIGGRPFIQLDNFRGRFDSPNLEALLTAERAFPVRVPYGREVTIDPSRFFINLTSNGVETTRDFANRSSLIRIRKREGYAYRSYPEGDLLQHVRARQPYYLGCVFAVIREWVQRGRGRTAESRHDFKEWCQVLDWIVQNILDESPLMDGHAAAQDRVSNPGLTFLRKIALAVAVQGRTGEWLPAHALYEIATEEDVDVPGLKAPDQDTGKRLIGSIMGRLYKDTDKLELEGFEITRRETITTRGSDGGSYPAKNYLFTKVIT